MNTTTAGNQIVQTQIVQDQNMNSEMSSSIDKNNIASVSHSQEAQNSNHVLSSNQLSQNAKTRPFNILSGTASESSQKITENSALPVTTRTSPESIQIAESSEESEIRQAKGGNSNFEMMSSLSDMSKNRSASGKNHLSPSGVSLSTSETVESIRQATATPSNSSILSQLTGMKISIPQQSNMNGDSDRALFRPQFSNVEKQRLDSTFSGLLTNLGSGNMGSDLIQKEREGDGGSDLLSSDLLENVEKSLTSGGKGNLFTSEGPDRSDYNNNVVKVLKDGNIVDKKKYSLSQLFGGRVRLPIEDSTSSSNSESSARRSQISSGFSNVGNASANSGNMSQQVEKNESSFSSSPQFEMNRPSTMTQTTTTKITTSTPRFVTSSLSNNSENGASMNGNLKFDVERDQNLDGILGYQVATVPTKGGEDPDNLEEDVSSILKPSEEISSSDSGNFLGRGSGGQISQSELNSGSTMSSGSRFSSGSGSNSNFNSGQILNQSQTGNGDINSYGSQTSSLKLPNRSPLGGNTRISVKIMPISSRSESHLGLDSPFGSSDSSGKIISQKTIVTDLQGAKKLLKNLIPSGNQDLGSGGFSSSSSSSSEQNGINLSDLMNTASNSSTSSGGFGGNESNASEEYSTSSISNSNLLKNLMSSSAQESSSNSKYNVDNSNNSNGGSFKSYSMSTPLSVQSSESGGNSQMSSSGLADLLKSTLKNGSSGAPGTITTTKITISGPKSASSDAALSLADLLRSSLAK